MKRWVWWAVPTAVLAAAAVVVAVLAVRGESGMDRLAAKDPRGAKACQMLADWLAGNLDGDQMTVSETAGRIAARSTTDGIRGTVGEPTEFGEIRFANLARLHAACRDAGVEMPAFAR